MGPYNRMFWFIVSMLVALFGVLVLALMFKWFAGEPDCKADRPPLACYWESAR